jgi:hypothetical protein
MTLALSHVVDFVLFLISTKRGSWLFIHMIILVFIYSFYSLLDLWYIT